MESALFLAENRPADLEKGSSFDGEFGETPVISGKSMCAGPAVALERGTGARGLRSVIEEVLEPVLFDVQAGVRYVVTEETVRGGKVVRRSMSQPKAPLSSHVDRRLRANSV